MRPNTKYSNDLPKNITVTNTNTGKQVEVEVAEMTDTSVIIYLANERIVLYKKNNIYVGNKFGMELTYTP
jgi:predicted ribosome-associated RNA-binding protein Tma20